MSLTAAIVVIVALVVILLSLLGFVMSRPRNLRPHRPSARRVRFSRARTRRPPPGAA
jgi:VIT1/CCC1 family predicted Fe2+/Mn2+ transporter